MALIALSDDELRSIFGRLCNPLRPFDAMDFGSANHGLRLLTKTLREELKEWHESVAALCCALFRNCYANFRMLGQELKGFVTYGLRSILSGSQTYTRSTSPIASTDHSNFFLRFKMTCQISDYHRFSRSPNSEITNPYTGYWHRVLRKESPIKHTVAHSNNSSIKQRQRQQDPA